MFCQEFRIAGMPFHLTTWKPHFISFNRVVNLPYYICFVLTLYYNYMVFLFCIKFLYKIRRELPCCLSSKKSACQGRRHKVWSLIQEDPTCCEATRLMRHNYSACALEPGSPATTEPTPQQLLKPTSIKPTSATEKPQQWEAPYCN